MVAAGAGWWLVAVVLLLLIVLIWYLWRRGAVRRAALGELRQLKRESGNSQKRVSTLTLLLRRYAIACYPGKGAEGLTGEAWLQFLDDNGGGGEFQRGMGRRLLDAPFQDQADIDEKALQTLVARWIRANRVRR